MEKQQLITMQMNVCRVCGSECIGKRKTCSPECGLTYQKNMRKYVDYSQYDKKYRINHLEERKKYAKLHTMDYRYRIAKQLGVRGKVIFKEVYLFLQKERICSNCDYKENKDILVIHHIVPISRGGTNESNNLEWLCPNCHAIKHSNIRKMRHPEYYEKK